MFLAYARVSSIDQKRPEKVSIGEQLKRCHAIAQARGEVGKYAYDTYVDEAVSGSIPLSQRPRGKPLLERAQQGDVICAAKLDRLFRSASDALSSIERLKARGVDVILADMGMEPVYDNPASKFFFGALALVAQFERERIAERMTEGRLAKFEKGGCIGGVPLGFTKDGMGSRSILIPPQEDVLELCRFFRKRGRTWKEVSQELAAKGMVSPNTGKPYHHFVLSRALKANRLRPKFNGAELVVPAEAFEGTEMPTEQAEAHIAVEEMLNG